VRSFYAGTTPVEAAGAEGWVVSGPINAIYFDRKHNTFWGGSSNHGEDYGIGS